jgi:hypothetical protein
VTWNSVMIFGTPGANIDDAKGLGIHLFNHHVPYGRLHRENSREEGDTGQNGDIQPLPSIWPIHWVSRILGLWLLPSDLDEAPLGLDTCNILFIFLALGRVVRIPGFIFAGQGIFGFEVGSGLRWRGGVR